MRRANQSIYRVYKGLSSILGDPLNAGGPLTSEIEQGRLISVAWACQAAKRQMNDCVKQYTTPESFDAARREHAREVPASVLR
mmetsp:Transcript_17900/g.44040  ORF Transcript_17900/g.44040 Transcript_17900/m.44040 type:complete len:83 (-) Transcript_17900:73-321(-)